MELDSFSTPLDPTIPLSSLSSPLFTSALPPDASPTLSSLSTPTATTVATTDAPLTLTDPVTSVPAAAAAAAPLTAFGYLSSNMNTLPSPPAIAATHAASDANVPVKMESDNTLVSPSNTAQPPSVTPVFAQTKSEGGMDIDSGNAGIEQAAGVQPSTSESDMNDSTAAPTRTSSTASATAATDKSRTRGTGRTGGPSVNTAVDDDDESTSESEESPNEDLPPASAKQGTKRTTRTSAAAAARSAKGAKEELLSATAALGAAANSTDEPALTIVYTPGGVLPKLNKFIGRTIEIRIPSKYLSSKNKEVATRQLWGSDLYTDDSDAVAILKHAGRVILRAIPPHNYTGLTAIFRVQRGAHNYTRSTRHHITSRSWSPYYHKCSLELVRSEIIEYGNIFQARVPGESSAANGSATVDGVASSANSKPSATPTTAAAPVSTPTPTAPPSSSSTTPTPRLKDIKTMRVLNGERPAPKHIGKLRQKFAPHTTLCYNTSADPCLRYSVNLLADRGFDEEEWTSMRLKREVLYLESEAGVRWELTREKDNAPSEVSNLVAGTGVNNSGVGAATGMAVGTKKYDRYRWSQVLKFPVYDPLAALEALANGAAASSAASTTPATGATPTTPAADTPAPGSSARPNKRRKTSSSGAVATSSLTSSTSSSPATPTKTPPVAQTTPLAESDVQVLERDLDWEHVEFGPNGVRVRGKEYSVHTMWYRKITPETSK